MRSERARHGESEAAIAAAADLALVHRMGFATLTVRDGRGAPVAGRVVTAEQTRHAFGFGNIGFDLIGLANGERTGRHEAFGGPDVERGELLARYWLDLFDTVTLPFYWAGFEPNRGTPDTARLLRAARWFADRGVRVKGHPLLWHTLAPAWLLPLPPDEVEATIRARIHREVSDFAGVIDVWDAINEVVIMPVFEKQTNAVTNLARLRGRVEMVRLAVESAREANPAVHLVLNDFDLTPAYEQLIEECLSAGVAFDALGLQTHMHQGYRGEAEIDEILDRFARFGLPLHLTETTLVSGRLMPAHIVDLNDYRVPSWPSTPEGEARQGKELVRHYRTMLAHPAVVTATYWGLTDEGAWLGAPAGLIRADGTAKPAYHALRRLVRGDWWLAPTTLRTDAAGQLRLKAFAGNFRLTAGDASTDFAVGAGTAAVDVVLPD